MVNYTLIIIIVLAIIFLAMIAWFIKEYIGYRKRKKERQKLIDAKTGLPLDVLADFEEAEKRLKETNGNPYQILWQIANERNKKKEVIQNGLHTESIARTTREPIARAEPTSISESNIEQPIKRKRGRPKGWIPSNKGVRRTTSNSSTANGNLSRDREPKQGFSVPIQSNTSSSEEQRVPKRNWINFN